MGRAVYCMQCIRLNKGHKDMFRSNTPAYRPCQRQENETHLPQPGNR